MSVTGFSTVEHRKDEKTRYLEADNVVDITKSDLLRLKSELKVNEEENLDMKLTQLNDRVEKFFNGYLLDERENTLTLTTKNGVQFTDSIKNIVASGDQDKLDALANFVVDKSEYRNLLDNIKNEEIKETIKSYQFELHDLRNEVSSSSPRPGNKTENVFLYDRTTEATEGGISQESPEYRMRDDYIDAYQEFGYTNITKDMDIADIYKDNKLKKYLEKIFDEEDTNNIRKGMFNINIGLQDGLAGIIVDIRKAIDIMENGTDNEESDTYQLYMALFTKNILSYDNEGNINLTFTKKNLKALIDSGLLTYNRKGGPDNIGKLAKVLTRAKREDLDLFASALQSKTDEVMAVKEIHNAREIMRHVDINKDNVLEFLCDFNSDGQLSTEYNKRFNKKQKSQGDVGTLFGQQVHFTLQQAIEVKNVELGDPQGEQLVISNILKHMEIGDSRNLTGNQRMQLDYMMSDPSYCTRAELAKLIDGDKEQGISPMPELKIFFLDSIRKINGGSNEVTPDLYDTLVGNDIHNMLNVLEDEAKLKQQLEKVLQQSEDPNVQELIREHGLVYVRQTLFTQIMTALDNVEISTNERPRKKGEEQRETSSLQAIGVKKGREYQALKKELLETMIETLITTGIHRSETKGLMLTLGYGKSGYLGKNQRTKYTRGVGGGVGWDRGPGGQVGIFVDISGEIAEQINYQQVINANLTQVKYANYLGVEAGARANVDVKSVKTIDVEASAGINRQRDPEVGINQIDKQYGEISAILFNLDPDNFSSNILKTSEAFTDHLNERVDSYKNHDKYGKFVTTNESYFKDSVIRYMVEYMEHNELFGKNSLILQKPEYEQRVATNTLLDIIQLGMREQRRHDVIAGLHGSIKLTKLSFGVTTNALSLNIGKTEAPGSSGSAGETVNEGNVTGGTGGNQGKDTFGICGLYIGLRISTWKNMYVPNDKQYLFTQHEIGQGLGLEYIENPTKDLEKYAAYLEALFNDQKGRLSCRKEKGSERLIIRFTRDDTDPADLTLEKFLNIHATTAAHKHFSLHNNTLIIGNVGDMVASTVTEAKGIRRILCLGTKKLDEAQRVTSNTTTPAHEVEEMKAEVIGYKEWKQKDIQTNIINNMTGQGQHLETAKSTTTRFFDSEGKLTSPSGVKVVFEPNSLEGTKLSNGTLLIHKNNDNTYRVTYDTIPGDKLTIIYRDQNEYDQALIQAQANPANYETLQPFSVSNFFSFSGELLSAQQELKRLLSVLEELEKNDSDAYSEFIKFTSAAQDTHTDQQINDHEITQAITHLETLMQKSGDNSQFTVLRQLLQSKDNTVKSYIIDRMKQILAREPGYKNMNIGSILAIHGGREGVRGPSKEKLPAPLVQEMRRHRSDLQIEHAKTLYNQNPPTNANLIGYTAFYRKNITKAYSLTSLGETSYQGEIKDISPENKTHAETRFLNNFKVNQFELEHLAVTLEQHFKANGIIVNLKKDSYQETSDLIEKLIKGEPITIDSGDKISIDVKRVFYLLGDCCNESIGMEITKINIQRFKDIPITGRYEATAESDEIYSGGIDLHTKSHSISNRVITQEMKVGRKHHRNKKNKAPEPSSTTGTHPPIDTDTGLQGGSGNNEQ